jgi:hypothetical protein
MAKGRAIVIGKAELEADAKKIGIYYIVRGRRRRKSHLDGLA